MLPRRGFSLIEAVVYVLLFILIFVAAFQTILQGLAVWGQARAERVATEGTALVLDRITHEILLAQSIASSTSVFGVNPGRLVLNSFVSATSSVTTTVTISLANKELSIVRNIGGTRVINVSTTLAVSSTVFSRVATSTSEGVRIQVIGEARRGRYMADRTLSAFTVLQRTQ